MKPQKTRGFRENRGLRVAEGTDAFNACDRPRDRLLVMSQSATMTFLDPRNHHDQALPSGYAGDGRRWHDLAPAIGLDSGRPLLLALSGGSDSIYLLHVLSAAQPRPDILAVHVDHGLRAKESKADADFCRDACAQLGIPFALERVELDPNGGSLEAQARIARYAVLERLARGARGQKDRLVLTAHHADDALETLLWRWTRGSAAPGLRPPAVSGPLPSPFAADLHLFRPLAHLRRADLRAWLEARAIPWREDSSNLDERHTRNRIRHGLLPVIQSIGGDAAIENLMAFGNEIEALETRLAQATAALNWEPLSGVEPRSGSSPRRPAGSIPRAQLACLPRALRRRGLWRLLHEGCDRAPGRQLLELLLDDLEAGRVRRHSLPGGASLHLRSDVLVLDFEQASNGRHTDSPSFHEVLPLVDGATFDLPDGRRMQLATLDSKDFDPNPNVIEFDGGNLPTSLTLRQARPGDRFHALGAPGSRRLVRFLADRGVPRAARARALVLVDPNGGELVAVLGHGPSESVKVRDSAPHWRLSTLGEHGDPSISASAHSPHAQRCLPGRRGRDTGF